MGQGSQALVYAMLVEAHYATRSRRTDRSASRRARTPVLRRFAAGQSD